MHTRGVTDAQYNRYVRGCVSSDFVRRGVEMKKVLSCEFLVSDRLSHDLMHGPRYA